MAQAPESFHWDINQEVNFIAIQCITNSYESIFDEKSDDAVPQRITQKFDSHVESTSDKNRSQPHIVMNAKKNERKESGSPQLAV